VFNMLEIETVGARELRQNLSEYLRRVATGESFRVTDRGREVAFLSPVPIRATPVERLLAAGRLRPASGDLAQLGPPLEVPLAMSTAEALDLERRED
jgi:prevent-host-death family protein